MAPVVTVRNSKKWRGMEGYGWQATIVVDGVRAAMVTDDGHGGPLRWDVFNAAALTSWATQVGAADAVLPNGHVRFDTPLDMAACTLVEADEHAKRVRRWCRTMTVFSVPGDEPGSYRTVKRKYDAAVRAHVLKQYPNAIIENERI